MTAGYGAGGNKAWRRQPVKVGRGTTELGAPAASGASTQPARARPVARSERGAPSLNRGAAESCGRGPAPTDSWEARPRPRQLFCSRPRTELGGAGSLGKLSAKNRAGENQAGRPDQAGQVGSRFPADWARRRGQPERRRKTRPAESRGQACRRMDRGPWPRRPSAGAVMRRSEASWWRAARSAE